MTLLRFFIIADDVFVHGDHEGWSLEIKIHEVIRECLDFEKNDLGGIDDTL